MFLYIYTRTFGLYKLNIGKIGAKLNIGEGVNSYFGKSALQKGFLFGPKKDDSFTHLMEEPASVMDCITVPVIDLYKPKQVLAAYTRPDFVQSLIDANPNIQELISSKGYNVGIYPENISNICDSHIDTTTYFANKIANEMSLSAADKKQLEQACTFHDYGKILIPSELINKPGELTQQEKEMVDLHSQLGYELLANTGMNNRVLNLIKNHHNPMSENSDVLGQILSVADIYSALREQRSYKAALTEEESFKLLDQKAQKGEVSTEVVNALKTALTYRKSA